jgi:hypothetical protein
MTARRQDREFGRMRRVIIPPMTAFHANCETASIPQFVGIARHVHEAASSKDPSIPIARIPSSGHTRLLKLLCF